MEAQHLGDQMSPIIRDTIYIDGAWVSSTGTRVFEVFNSTTEALLGVVPAGSTEDVDKAVAAAKRAFPAWSKTSPGERAEYCTRIADGLYTRLDEIATLICKEVGMAKPRSRFSQAALPVNSFGIMASVVADFPFEETQAPEISGQMAAYIEANPAPLAFTPSRVVREPVGVVGCITPWNYPLHQIAAKVAPALTAGCTVVLKPSEVAPLNAYILAEVIHEVGLPAGVFNMVMGDGPVIGESIAGHPDIDMVSFTGSTRAGKRITELCAQRVARVSLELGGKSPNVILRDADLQKAIADGVMRCYVNSGQTCSALTRMIVPRERLAEAEEIAGRIAETLTVGDPLSEGTVLGPLVSQTQWDRVEGYIKKGIDEGAKLVAGGLGRPGGLQTGYFVKPTVFSEVRRDMTIAQEEIFGPVLSIIPYESEEEAIEIAHDSDYGLSGGVWAGSQERAEAVARQLRTGQVIINGGGVNLSAPFGGYKQSGIGREYGAFGLEEYLEHKNVNLPAG
jgi:acyl-CoA reductase-like NAD-dependent aldehyde dehydrogenase